MSYLVEGTTSHAVHREKKTNNRIVKKGVGMGVWQLSDRTRATAGGVNPAAQCPSRLFGPEMAPRRNLSEEIQRPYHERSRYAHALLRNDTHATSPL